MASEREITEKFWKAVKSDRTVMLGLVGAEDGMSQPMTALLEDEAGGPLWIFTAKDTDLVQELGERGQALVHFASKGHDLFAAVEQHLDAGEQAVLVQPDLGVIRLEAQQLKLRIVLAAFVPGRHVRIPKAFNGRAVIVGDQHAFGRDPKKDYEGKVAEVRL